MTPACISSIARKLFRFVMGPRGFFCCFEHNRRKDKKGVLTLDRKIIFDLIDEERDRQDVIHPIIKRKYDDKNVELIANLIDQTDFLAVLVEEIGEVARAMQGEGSLREELIQTASVCVRWLEQFK
jgi:hypothetical protein